MGHHAKDAQAVSVLGRYQWLTCSVQHFDSQEWFSILDRQCGDTEDLVIVTLIPVDTPSEVRVPVVLASLSFFSLAERGWGL